MDAREIIVQNHAFESWDAYAAFSAEAKSSVSLVGRFEEAVDAIVSGNVPTLEWLLRSRPELIHERSARNITRC